MSKGWLGSMRGKRETDNNLQHVYVIPVGQRLERALAIFNPRSIPAMVDTAINAVSGTRMSIERWLHPDLHDENLSLVREAVAGIHRAIEDTYPEIHDRAQGWLATKVEYDRRNLYIVMEPIVNHSRSSHGG